MSAGSDTPQGIVDAINGAGLGVTATFDSSNKIQLTGHKVQAMHLQLMLHSQIHQEMMMEHL